MPVLPVRLSDTHMSILRGIARENNLSLNRLTQVLIFASVPHFTQDEVIKEYAEVMQQELREKMLLKIAKSKLKKEDFNSWVRRNRKRYAKTPEQAEIFENTAKAIGEVRGVNVKLEGVGMKLKRVIE